MAEPPAITSREKADTQAPSGRPSLHARLEPASAQTPRQAGGRAAGEGRARRNEARLLTGCEVPSEETEMELVWGGGAKCQRVRHSQTVGFFSCIEIFVAEST